MIESRVGDSVLEIDSNEFCSVVTGTGDVRIYGGCSVNRGRNSECVCPRIRSVVRAQSGAEENTDREARGTGEELVVFGQISADLKDILQLQSPFETETTLRQIPGFTTSEAVRAIKRFQHEGTRTYRYNPLEPGIELPTSVEDDQAILRAKSGALLRFLSEHYVHEGEHRRLATDEHQYYIEDQLNSFRYPLLYVAGRLNTADLTMFAAETGGQILNSRLVQEAQAIRAQRQFLQQYPQGVAEVALEDIDYKAQVDAYLETGQIADKVEATAVYACADWLAARIEQHWAIDVSDVAFRFAKPYACPEGVVPAETLKLVAPDLVFLIAAFTDPADIGPVDRQRAVLERTVHQVMNDGTEHYNPAFEVMGRTSGGFTIQDRDTIAGRYMAETRELAAANGAEYLLPLVCRTYPGKESIRWPLWRLLNNLYLVTEVHNTADDARITRSLWGDTEILDGWAANTPLLDIAVRLLELRDATYLPLVEVQAWRYGVQMPKLLAMMESDTYDRALWPYYVTGSTGKGKRELTRLVADVEPDRYQDVLTALTVLGRAIRRGDERLVKAFF